MSLKEALEAIDGVDHVTVGDNGGVEINIWLETPCRRNPEEVFEQIREVRPAHFSGSLRSARGQLYAKYFEKQ